MTLAGGPSETHKSIMQNINNSAKDDDVAATTSVHH